MKNLLTIIIVSIFYTNLLAQQNQEWKAFHSGVNLSSAIAIENDTMWIATLGGLFKYNLNTGSSIKYDRTNANFLYYEITNLVVDNQGNKWFGNGNFIIKYDGNSFTNFNAIDYGIPVYASLGRIKLDQQGNVWFAFDYGGLLKFNGTNWQSYTPDNSGLTFAGPITDFDFDADGSIWIGSYGYFLFNFNGTSTTVYDYNNSGILSHLITSIVVDSQNNKWIGTPMGLQKFNNQNWITYNSFNSGLPGNHVTRLSLDHQNNLWISIGYSDYLVKYDNVSWQIYDYSNSPVSADYIFADDQNGNMWFARYGNVYRLQNNNWLQYNNYTDFKLYTTITSFAQDSAGNYWFGTYYSGLVKFDGVSWQNFNTSNSDLPSNRITGISYNSQSGLWIATADTGIVNYDGNNWTNYNTSNSPLISNYTTTIITDNNNKKWIGTTGNGIQYISGNMSQWVNFSYNNSGLLSNNIRKLYFDNSTGKLWILHSTSNIAPQSFDGWIWKSYDTLVSNYDMVWDIQTDDQSNTWFGTTHSLAKLTGTNWAFYNSFNSGLPINGPVISISKDLNGSIWLVNQNQNNYNIAFVNFDGNNWISLDYVDYPIMSRVYFQTVQTDKWGNKWFYINPISGSYLFSALVYKQGGVVLSAEDQTNFGQPIINNFILEQNYPNPFNPSTKIKYVIPNGVRNLVTLKVYDVLGNEVATLVNEEKPAGIYEVEFNASKLSSGIYFYKLQAGSFVETKKMILLK